MVEFVKNRRIFYILSGVLVVASLVLIFLWGLNPGIDFVGGTIIELKVPKLEKVGELSDELNKLNLGQVNLQPTEKQTLIVRTKIAEEENLKKIEDTLKQRVGESELIYKEVIGPTVSQDIVKRTIWMVSIGVLAIIFYISWSFRQVPKPVSSWVLSLGTIIALIHDLIISLGSFALMAHFFSFEASSIIVVALLTILGFSVHDTIVVLDRTRENLIKKWGERGKIGEIVNSSLNQTLTRSLNTSLTVLLVLGGLLLFGGISIRPFVAILAIGIIVGTYSSIFIASQFVISWYGRKLKMKN